MNKIVSSDFEWDSNPRLRAFTPDVQPLHHSPTETGEVNVTNTALEHDPSGIRTRDLHIDSVVRTANSSMGPSHPVTRNTLEHKTHVLRKV